MFTVACMTVQEPGEGLRLCHLSKWPNFEGYGFAVNADRHRKGQFVAHVDFGSPAHLGGLRKKDRILEVNGESVEGASYRDVVNRIKLDPSKVALLVIDRETDEAFARQRRTPNSREDCMVECRTPPAQPPSYAIAPGSRRSVSETPRVPLKSDAPTVVPGDALNGGSTAAGKPQGNQLINSFWPTQPASQSVPLLVARPMMLVAPEQRQHEDKDDSQRDQQRKHQPVKSDPREIAPKPFPSLYTIKESPSPPTSAIKESPSPPTFAINESPSPPTSAIKEPPSHPTSAMKESPSPPTSATFAFMTSHLPASTESLDNGSPPHSPARSASEYFSAHEVSSAPKLDAIHSS
ncbi:hypothetical protein MTO96_051580 [Rhipicephalus appendiculatus]